jgi:hypothetical protein
MLGAIQRERADPFLMSATAMSGPFNRHKSTKGLEIPCLSP